LISGSVGAPPLSFLAESNTGMYYVGTGEIGFSIVGTKRFGLTATGLTITGSGTFTGGVAGGVF
jgi:hypothetical protein